MVHEKIDVIIIIPVMLHWKKNNGDYSQRQKSRVDSSQLWLNMREFLIVQN